MRGIKGTTPGHGTLARYNAGCRDCQPCRDAANRREQRRRASGQRRIVDATGTRRRLQALAAMGWSMAALASRLGMNPRLLSRIARQDRVYETTHRRVASLFTELCMTPGPSEQARRRALTKGWAPPLAWDDIDDPTEKAHANVTGSPVDEVAVLRAVHRGVGAGALTRAERTAATERMARLGYSDARIASHLGVTSRTVERIRKRHAIPSTWTPDHARAHAL